MLKKLSELIKFGFWGAVSTGINLLLFYLFIFFGMPYIVSNVVSYIIAVIFSYVFNNRFVFKETKDKESTKQLKYFTVRAISIAVDSIILAFLHETIGLPLMVSKILDSVVIILSTYIVSKFWIFTRKKNDGSTKV